MEWFQLIFDSSTRCGLILSGTKKFENDFKGWVASEKLGVPELNSRIDEKWIVLDIPKKPEMKQVALRNGVTDPALLKKLLDECSDYRRLFQKIVNLRIEKVKNSKPEFQSEPAAV